MTLDEPLYILQGTYLFDQFCAHGPTDVHAVRGGRQFLGRRSIFPTIRRSAVSFLILAHERMFMAGFRSRAVTN